MSMANYLEEELLDHIFGEGAYTPPTWYVGLSTSDPGEAGATLAEPVAMGYARKAVGATTRTGSSVVNDAAIEFAAATGNWGTITHCALFDSLSGGNMLWSGALTVSKTVISGDTVKFSAGALSFSLD